MKNVMYGRSQCYQKPLLLKLILVKKIIENEKRGTCFVKMENHKDLYTAQRQSVSIPNTATSCRDKLRTIRKGSTEGVKSINMRFRQQLNELIYAIPNKQSKAGSRRIVTKQETVDGIKAYIMNPKEDIGQ